MFDTTRTPFQQSLRQTVRAEEGLISGYWLAASMVVFLSTGKPASARMQAKLCPHSLTTHHHVPARLLPSCFHLSLYLLPTLYIWVLLYALTSPSNTDFISSNHPHLPSPVPTVLGRSACLRSQWVSAAKRGAIAVHGTATLHANSPGRCLRPGCQVVIIPWLT